jgi:endoglycosylceramidase
VDPRRLVFYEPPLQFSVGFVSRPDSTNDARAGFSFHVYCAGYSEPVCRAREQLSFEAAQAQSRATGEALLLSEFGATDQLAALATVPNLADRSMVSWQEWAV